MSIPVLHASDEQGKLIAQGDNTITLSGFTVDNVSNRVLVVGIAINVKAAGACIVLSASYGAQSLVKSVVEVDEGRTRVEIWELIAPNIGTADVTVTITDPSGGVTRATVISALLFRNANQSDPLVNARSSGTGSTVGDPTETVQSMNEELVIAALAAQNDRVLNVVTGQTDHSRLVQAGATPDENIQGYFGTKQGTYLITEVGWTGGSTGSDNAYSIMAVPIIGPDVSLEARGTTETQGEASMSLDMPLEADLIGDAEALSILGAKNWFQAILSGVATALSVLQRAKHIVGDLAGSAALGSRTGTNPRMFLDPDNANLKLQRSFNVELRDFGNVQLSTTINFQSREHGVFLRATVKLNDQTLNVGNATAWLYVENNPFSPFPMSIEGDGSTGVLFYIAGRGDFPAGNHSAEIDVLLESGRQYRSGTFILPVEEVIL